MEKRNLLIKTTGDKIFVACANCKHGYATTDLIENNGTVTCKKCRSEWQISISEE